MKTLIVVSGGDAPGINPALAAFTTLVSANGGRVVGALGGFAGLLNNQLVPLSPTLLMPWIGQPGTYLQSSREPVLSQPDAPEKLKTVLKNHHIDNVLLLGGDGSLRHIPPLLQRWGVACIGLPTTIDNDVPGTEMTLGFDSACNYAYQTIDGIRATAYALQGRIFSVETLGGNTGFLALEIAAGAGAHAVVIPEYSYTPEWLANRLLDSVTHYGYGLLLLSEGVAEARTLADDLARLTHMRIRDARLGHAQRGSIPSHRDRLLSAQMTRCAFSSFQQGATLGTVVVHSGEIKLHEGLINEFPARVPSRALYHLVNGLDNDV